MRPGTGARLAAGIAAACLLSAAAMAQEAAPPDAAAPAAGESAPAKPKPRPKPKPKPAPKAAPKPDTGSEAGPSVSGGAAPMAETPELRGRREESGSASEQDRPDAAQPVPAAPPQATFAAPPVACEPGQGVLYDGPNGFSLWVTRTGAVTIDNPLRPLTPDVTRVLQLVIAGKLATAYGRDLSAVRRGASPRALEGLLGGPIQWDASLASLPDSLDIVSDSGAPLAQMRFKECGTAPAAKALPEPVAKREPKPKTPRKAPSSVPGAPAPQGAGGTPAPARHPTLPQGAIPE